MEAFEDDDLPFQLGNSLEHDDVSDEPAVRDRNSDAWNSIKFLVCTLCWRGSTWMVQLGWSNLDART